MVLSPGGAVLLLIDLQERLMPVIADHEVVVARAVRLAEAATLLDVPVRATEQNPAGLGPTVPPLSGYPQAVLAKTTFSAAGDPGLAALLPAGGEIVVAGVEAHVCVLQTGLDLLDAGHDDVSPGGQQRGEARVGRRRERRLGQDRLRVAGQRRHRRAQARRVLLGGADRHVQQGRRLREPHGPGHDDLVIGDDGHQPLLQVDQQQDGALGG